MTARIQQLPVERAEYFAGCAVAEGEEPVPGNRAGTQLGVGDGLDESGSEKSLREGINVNLDMAGKEVRR